MKILLLGDSHTDIFVHMPNVTRFNTSLCQSAIFTVHRFTDDNDIDLWSKLDPWLQEQAQERSSLIISGGEIDIRAHFWRHIPRSYSSGDDIENYVKAVAVKFYQSLVSVRDRYNLEHIVVWGVPVAGDGALYNLLVPFGGTANTRNRLIHMWNRSFLETIKDDTTFTLATAYYDFIDPATYLTVTPNPSHDGVHWHDRFGPVFWEKLILPSLNNKMSMVGNNYNLMYNDKFDMGRTQSQATQKYDSWISSDQLSNIQGLHRSVSINGETYWWVPDNEKHRLPEHYTELSLTNI